MADITLTLGQALQEAIAHQRAERWPEAERLWRAILQTHPSHSDAHHNLGVLAFQTGQPATGLAHLKAAVDANPAHAQYWLSYAEALLASERPEDARSVLRQGVQRGLSGAAVDGLMARIVAKCRSPSPPSAMFAEALRHHGAGQLAEAEAQCFRILSADPGHADSHNLLGVIAAQTGRLDLAAQTIRKAISLDDGVASYHTNLGNALKFQCKYDEAVACYQRALVIRPRFPEALCNLGNALRDQGRLDEAIVHYKQALEIDPKFAEGFYNLGNALRDQDRLAESVECYERALVIRPDFLEALSNLGIVSRDLGRLDEAIARYDQALAIMPNNPEILSNLGNALKDQGKLDEAMARYRQALVARPDYPEALYNLGAAYQDRFMLDEAILSYERALAIRPVYTDALSALGSALQEQGNLDEAFECYQRAVSSRADCSALQNLVSLQLYRPETGLDEIAGMARRWDEALGSAYKSGWPIHRRSASDAETRPRIGFVSGDFCAHPVGLLVVPTVEGLSRAGYHVSCYANHRYMDELTTRFQTAAARWRFIAGLSDDAVAKQIRADEIDILIDLSGHTGKNRLPVFARKPAPVQIAWVGYPATTGLEAMDFLIADSFQVPRGSDGSYVEKIIRLPDSYIGFEPPSDAEPVGELPALADGRITFGSFNALKKITPPTIAAWSRILHRLPNSRLLMKAPAFNCEVTRDYVRKRFDERGIGSGQLWLVGGTSRAEHRACMGKADIALDPFPYTGGMTTLEALWSGLPVITMVGDTFCGRHSFGYLSTIGLADLVAENVDRYVELAIELAGDLPRLGRSRQELRQRMVSSPLCDIDRFVVHMDMALMTAWRRWRDEQPIASFDVVSSSLWHDRRDIRRG